MPSQFRNVKISKYNFELIPFLITLIGIVILVTLGFWQLYRLKEKNDFIRQVTDNLNNPPLIYSTDHELDLYNKVKLKGNFLSNKNVHLYGRKSTTVEKDGYYLLSPFKTYDGKIFIVARGWFAAKNKAQVSDIYDNSEEEITGIILPPERKRFFIPANDLKNNVWFTLNIGEISSNFQINPEDFYILEVESQNLPQYLKPLKTDGLISIKNDHLEYAITWFSLAVCLIVVFIAYNKKGQI